MKKRLLSLLLAAALVLALGLPALAAGSDSFTASQTYREGQFADVSASAWYAAGVQKVYELGLMKGRSDSRFCPNDDMTLAEALALACRLNDICSGGTGAFAQGSPWYQVYAEEAASRGILADAEASDLTRPVTRAEFAGLMAAALPEEEYAALNQITSLPDVTEETENSAAIFTLYNAGVLTGSDAYGTFGPDESLERAAAALIAARIADPSLRVQFTPAQETTVTDYSNPDSWALYADGEGDADVFYLCAAVDKGTGGNYTMSLDSEKNRSHILGAWRQQEGIYNENAVVYVPCYQQATFTAYYLEEDQAAQYFDIAYADVKAAFEYYLARCDESRPLILAGFSQGAEMVIRLLKDFGNDPAVADRLVAAYAIGWRLTQEDVEEYPWLVPASGEDDTGCIVTFDCEAEDITSTVVVPEGTRTYSINPLNWKTDSTPADASENPGACFTDYSGNITSEIPALTGAYIDEDRGTLKCPDIDPAEYTSSLFENGIYHLNDCFFFYRSLQRNVAVRLAAWQAQH